MGGELVTSASHPPYRRVEFAERRAYCDWVVESYLERQKEKARLVSAGIAAVFDGVDCRFMSGRELMSLVVGVGEVHIEELRSITKYDGFSADDEVIVWFWEVLEEMNSGQRIAFLQFATARSRLPIFSHQSPLTVGVENGCDV